MPGRRARLQHARAGRTSGILGDVAAELYVSADVQDADVFIKLVDVYPDGTACNLADSCLRLRYRDGFDQPAGLMPGEICHIRIGGMTTASYFPAGHRIRIEITGSNFPLADATGTPANATTWPPTARSLTSPCITGKDTSRHCTSPPTPARSQSTRRCLTPGRVACRAGSGWPLKTLHPASYGAGLGLAGQFQSDQRGGQRADLQRPAPVGVVAGQPGYVQAEHDPGPGPCRPRRPGAGSLRGPWRWRRNGPGWCRW